MSGPLRGLLLMALCLVGGCGGDRLPNVLVVVIDTLRADRVSWYGTNPELTPFLGSLGERGFVFWNAQAACSWTSPSMASLWTSRFPSQHSVTSAASRLSGSERTLAEVLQQNGYASGGFSANLVLSAAVGFAQGFDHYESFQPPSLASAEGPLAVKERADSVNGKALAWLDTLDQSRSPRPPVFLYVHYMEPHTPYGPPQEIADKVLGRRADAGRETQALDEMLANPERRKHPVPEAVAALQDLYDGEVMSADLALRELFAGLEHRGFLTDALVVVTADHGEEFMEHGGLSHGTTLYEELLHVPLLVRLPGQTERQDLHQTTSLVDVAPTVLDLVGILRPASVEGRSLASLLRRPPLARRVGADVEWLAGRRGPAAAAAFAELITNSRGQPMPHHDATVVDSRKLIVRTDGAVEAYDLRADPGERNSDGLTKSAREPVVAAMRDLRERAARAVSPSSTYVPDEGTKTRLRALGYLN